MANNVYVKLKNHSTEKIRSSPRSLTTLKSFKYLTSKKEHFKKLEQRGSLKKYSIFGYWKIH